MDIGTGSGYIAACFAEMAGKEGFVIALDHIPEIVAFATNNIKKKNGYLFKLKRMKMVTCDGRTGYAKGGPYDVIHVGGAIESVPSELEAQLAPGGRMWVPMGPMFSQAIYVIDKDMEGNLNRQKLMEVRYGSLTSVDQQLSGE